MAASLSCLGGFGSFFYKDVVPPTTTGGAVFRISAQGHDLFPGDFLVGSPLNDPSTLLPSAGCVFVFVKGRRASVRQSHISSMRQRSAEASQIQSSASLTALLRNMAIMRHRRD